MIPDLNANGHLPPGIPLGYVGRVEREIREESMETAPVDGTGSRVGELEGSRLPNGLR